MGTREAQRVVLFREIATKGCGDGPGTCIKQPGRSIIPNILCFLNRLLNLSLLNFHSHYFCFHDKFSIPKKNNTNNFILLNRFILTICFSTILLSSSSNRNNNNYISPSENHLSLLCSISIHDTSLPCSKP
ncbi:unnamed protein product [Vicia faba]|uniref:Uncharacterized protein n=1 Tax=Vicia faba TaxID=3906 RepID=A0AAV1AUP5_VICFA|nr:unnamed protein product [Vicia faba]